MWWLYIPLVVIGLLLLLFLVVVLLGRYKNGALLRPVIARLSRIGFMRRFFTKVSTAAIERQNPELASALKKINPVASNPNPQALQKAMSRLTPAERRAYMEAAGEQGGVPDSANRQMRRQAERMQQQARGGRPGGGGGGSSRKPQGRLLAPLAVRSEQKRAALADARRRLDRDERRPTSLARDAEPVGDGSAAPRR